MVNVEDAVIARLKRDGFIFEVLVDYDKAIEFRSGKKKDFNEVLVSEHVYKDAKKGLLASENDVKKVFGSSDVVEVGKEIINSGKIQVTKEHMAKEREEKLKKIIDIIHRNAVGDNGLPHPPERIRSAIEEAKVSIDYNKSAEEQVREIVVKLREVIPIKFELKNLKIVIPAKYTGQCYNVLKRYCKVLKEDWQNDGSLIVDVEVAAGIYEEFESKLNSLTHGEVEIGDLKR